MNYFYVSIRFKSRDVLFEYHRAVAVVEQLDQLEVCLPYSRLLTGIPILEVFQNLMWNSNKTSLQSLAINVKIKDANKMEGVGVFFHWNVEVPSTLIKTISLNFEFNLSHSRCYYDFLYQTRVQDFLFYASSFIRAN